MASKLPEIIYMVTVDGEWPVSVVVDGPAAVGDVYRVAENRRTGQVGQQKSMTRVRVWKAALTDVREVDLIPPRTLDPEIKERK